MSALPYRLYTVDRKGNLGAPLDIVFDDAIEALDYANRQRVGTQIELWQGAELIARLKDVTTPPRF
jgi:hypothetical protein